MRTSDPASRRLGLRLRLFARDEAGATAIEYALIAAGISLAVTGALALIGPRVAALYQAVIDALTAA